MSAFCDQSPGIKMAPVFSELNMRYLSVERAEWTNINLLSVKRLVDK